VGSVQNTGLTLYISLVTLNKVCG